MFSVCRINAKAYAYIYRANGSIELNCECANSMTSGFQKLLNSRWFIFWYTIFQCFISTTGMGNITMHSPLQKRESTEASFLYWLNWKSKHFNWNINEWRATQLSFYQNSTKSFQLKIVWLGTLQKLQNSIQTLIIFGLFTQSIQTLFFGWYLKSYHFAVSPLQILLFLVKALKFCWFFIWIF